MNDAELVARMRVGDALAFREAVAAHQPGLLRLARTFVPSQAAAEEVMQETWIAVIHGIDRFEHRSSLRTWITRILVNIAKRKGINERRTVPMGSLLGDDGDDAAVAPDRFTGPPGRGAWADPPARWSELPEEVVMSNATISLVVDTIQRLPEQQRAVVMLRDVEDWSASDVCAALDLSDANQRVLLHRGRSTLRGMLEDQIGAMS